METIQTPSRRRRDRYHLRTDCRLVRAVAGAPDSRVAVRVSEAAHSFLLLPASSLPGFVGRRVSTPRRPAFF